MIYGNRIENNDFVGIAISDYCLPLIGTPYQCPPPFGIPGLPFDPTVTPEFLADQSASNNAVVGNILEDNATSPPGPPFGDFAGDLSLLTFFENGNCYADNVYTTFFSTLGVLPACQ